MVSNNEAFDIMSSVDPEIDYTGMNADYHLEKYVNRPEDKGNLKDLQKVLSDMGIVNPGADAINAAIYASQGEWGNAGLSSIAVIPILGEIRNVQKVLKKSGEKMVTLYRGVDKWYPGQMVKEGKFIGGFKDTGVGHHANIIIGPQPSKTLWTTGIKVAGKNYTRGKGPLLKFEVPESYIKEHGIYQPWKHAPKASVAKAQIKAESLGSKYPVVAFPDGLPKQFLKKVIK